MGNLVGRRWLPIHCKTHGVDHSVSAGAAILIIESAMNGELITVKGNTLCVLENIGETPRMLGDRVVDFAPEENSEGN